MSVHNSYSLSKYRAHQQREKEDRKPLARLAHLLNIYHSIDNLDATKEEKERAKKTLREEIHSNFKYIGDGMQRLVKSSLNSKDHWESVKERFF